MQRTRIAKLTLLGMTLLGPVVMTAAPGFSQVSVQVGVGIALPPPIVFQAPPRVVVLPGTYAYAVPDVADDLYFVDGYWWRPWQGHWYRSRYYDRGWGAYANVPSFYGNLNQNWRSDYRDHHWDGQQWDYEPMPYDHVEKNWKSWKQKDYWKKDKSWGVKGYKETGHAQKSKAAAPPKHSSSKPPKGGHGGKGKGK